MQLIFSKPQSAPHRTTPLGKFRPPPIRHQPQPFRPTLLWVNGFDLESNNYRLYTAAYPRLRISLMLSYSPVGPLLTALNPPPLSHPLRTQKAPLPRLLGKRRLQLATHCVMRHSLRAIQRQLFTSCRPCHPLGRHQQQRRHQLVLAYPQPQPRWSGTALRWKQRSAKPNG